MLRLNNTNTMNFYGAIHGMRNPLNSWNKSDSVFDSRGEFIIGANDHKLAMRLATAGSDHAKFLRQIFVCVDIEAPLYWWKEFDTYKVGTVANSTSTMHKMGSRELTADDFSWDINGEQEITVYRESVLYKLNKHIEYINRLKKDEADSDTIKEAWRELIQDLPSSYNQMRTITMNYENLRNMYFARKNHKLVEWHTFCKWVEELPYSEFIITPRK